MFDIGLTPNLCLFMSVYMSHVFVNVHIPVRVCAHEHSRTWMWMWSLAWALVWAWTCAYFKEIFFMSADVRKIFLVIFFQSDKRFFNI
jgi:hypothetical protein